MPVSDRRLSILKPNSPLFAWLVQCKLPQVALQIVISGQCRQTVPHTLDACVGEGLAASEHSLTLNCVVDEDAWKAASSVMQVNELWAAVEHFHMQQHLGHRITRGRREDACRMLEQLAATVCFQSLACCVLFVPYYTNTFGFWS